MESRETAYLITAIVSLATAVVTLWVRNNKISAKYADQQNQNLLKSHEVIVNMTEEIAKNSVVIENNTKAHERVFDYFISKKKG